MQNQTYIKKKKIEQSCNFTKKYAYMLIHIICTDQIDQIPLIIVEKFVGSINIFLQNHDQFKQSCRLTKNIS